MSKLHKHIGDPQSNVELAEMAGGLLQAIDHLDAVPAEPTHLVQAIGLYLSERPNIRHITAIPANLRENRKKALTRVKELRNTAAHANTPPAPEAILALWHDTILDPEHAFFRWFPPAMHDAPTTVTPGRPLAGAR